MAGLCEGSNETPGSLKAISVLYSLSVSLEISPDASDVAELLAGGLGSSRLITCGDKLQRCDVTYTSNQTTSFQFIGSWNTKPTDKPLGTVYTRPAQTALIERVRSKERESHPNSSPERCSGAHGYG
ncbi:hypothetical protein ANN_15941 [Periplaneta americana]|uniref:Uncharacterized protein n=1 Tax=Periplaneta americana TaxID=6978 RepID=A0ABQ8SHM3_PERAM|nr:hypothetical protein ANN_15941 [Periplaneta americana]